MWVQKWTETDMPTVVEKLSDRRQHNKQQATIDIHIEMKRFSLFLKNK